VEDPTAFSSIPLVQSKKADAACGAHSSFSSFPLVPRLCHGAAAQVWALAGWPAGEAGAAVPAAGGTLDGAAGAPGKARAPDAIGAAPDQQVLPARCRAAQMQRREQPSWGDERGSAERSSDGRPATGSGEHDEGRSQNMEPPGRLC